MNNKNRKFLFRIVIAAVIMLVCLSGHIIAGPEKDERKLLAEAKEDPLACVFFVAKTLDYLEASGEKVAIAYAQTGQYEKAFHLVGMIKSASTKTRALAGIAETYIDRGQKDKALGLLPQAIKFAENIEDDESRGKSLMEIAVKYYKAGKKRKALKMLSLAKTIDSKELPLVRKYIEIGEYKEALRLSDKIENVFLKSRALADIAGQYGKVGRKGKALKILSQAYRLANPAEKDYVIYREKTEALCDIAVKYKDIGERDKALNILSQAFQNVKVTKEDWISEIIVLGKLSNAYAEIGEYNQAFQIAQNIKNSSYKAIVLVKIALKYAGTGEKNKSLELISQVFKIVFKHSDTISDCDKAFILENILSCEYIEPEYYDKCFKVVQKMGSHKGDILYEIAFKYAKTGQEVDDKAKKILSKIVRECKRYKLTRGRKDRDKIGGVRQKEQPKLAEKSLGLTMSGVLFPSIIALGSLGVLFGLGLGMASKVFAIKTDPKVDEIESLLAGANCGACGFAGCRNFAEALVKGKTGLKNCAPTETGSMRMIAKLMGQNLEEKEKEIAVVYCQGGLKETEKDFYYQGISDCHAALLFGVGDKRCQYSCLGYGSCVKVCPFEAIFINNNGLPVVNKEKCVGCGECTNICPRKIIKQARMKSVVHILCSSHDKGAVVRKICKVGCIGCARCVKVCPKEAISLTDSLAIIDYKKCINCGLCVKECPTKTIITTKKKRLQKSEVRSQKSE
jgi:Na+-translocating ferredoxin:NAD+ oxidoreductase RNF subunit RnfB